jgi:hypothetical protein
MERWDMQRAYILLVFLCGVTLGIASQPVDINAVCDTATETFNGVSVRDICSAWKEALYQSEPATSPAPSILNIFPSAATTPADATTQALLSVPSTTSGSRTTNLAKYYAVLVEPGLGCVLTSSNGLTDGFIPIHKGLLLAVSPAGTFQGQGSFLCKFRNPRDMVPVPPGAVARLTAENLTFPGSFSTIRSRLFCQFSTYTRVNPKYPVNPANALAGSYGSLTA